MYKPDWEGIGCVNNMRMAEFSAKIAYLLGRFQTSQWLPACIVQEEQRQALAYVLDHFGHQSSWFRDNYLSAEIQSLLDSGGNALQAIPITTRTVLQSRMKFSELYDAPAAHGELSTSWSSGTTGSPVSVRRTEVCLQYWMAYVLRDALNRRLDFGRRTCFIRGGGTLEPVFADSWRAPASLLFDTGASMVISAALDLSKLAWEIFRFRPAYLNAPPSIVRALARHGAEGKRALEKIEKLQLYTEASTREERQELSEEFGIEVTDMYSTQEIGIIAFSCPKSGGYHVNSETLIVEIVKDNGEPCAIGEIGRVLITDLFNYATPLVRYELGDFAAWGEICSCGRTSPVVEKIYGRKRNLVRTPTGERYWPRIGPITRHLRESYNITACQFVQSSLSTITVRLALSRSLDDEAYEDISNVIRKWLRYQFEIEYEVHMEMLPEINGKKWEDYVNLVDAYDGR
jgi:phenylacetate-CoA ligase